jgi:O-antigen ligase
MLLLGIVAALGAIALSGTKIGVALALFVVFGPIAAYAAFASPLVFPFCLFILLVPFDNLLEFSSFGTATKGVGVLCGAAIVLWLIRTRRYVVPDRALLAWLPFVLLAIASFAWAADPAMGLPTLSTLVASFGLYGALSFFPINRRTLSVVVAAVIAGGAIAATYGSYLFHRGIGVSQDGRLFIGGDGSGRIDPNHFAAALLLPLALAISAVIESRRFTVRVLAAVALVLLSAGIVIAGSRGSIVAVVAMIVYLFVRSRKRLLLGGIAFAGLAAGLVLFGKIADRFSQIAATGGAGRLGVWKVSLAAFWLHPIAGMGFGNFQVAYNNVFLTVPAFASMKIIEGARWNMNPHNNIVWVAVELGILGVVAFLYAWWAQFRTLRSIAPESDLYSLRVALEAALIALFVASMFLGTVNYKYLWLVFMMVMLTRNASLNLGRSKP